jgi:Fe-S cluster assembly protein SufD
MADRADLWRQLPGAAQARADSLGPPVSSAEDWRYVDVRALATPLSAHSAFSPGQIATHRAGQTPCAVLVDGRLVESPDGLPPGTLLDLNALPEDERAVLLGRWSSAISSATDASQCWSLADGGTGIRIRAGAQATGSSTRLHLLLVSTGARSGCRLVIEVAARASLELVISHLELAQSRSSVGIDARVEADGRLAIDELQYAASALPTALLVSHATLDLAERAIATWVVCHQGGALVRSSIQVNLAGLHSEFHLGCLIALSERRQAHLLTRVNHLVGETTSTQLVKTIADGQSQASFDGLVRIVKGADLANARQYHHNLLLSPNARVDTRPQLDIAADDVQAAHGATVGRPNPDELFYLRSRGIETHDALTLLRRGFAREPVLMLSNPHARALADTALLGTLAGG